MWSFLALFALRLAAAEECKGELHQDLNCNGIDASEELPVDTSDAECASNTDGAGDPWPNADYYFDYHSYGCEFLVLDLDVDGDGFSDGELVFPDDGTSYPDLSVSFTCDVCPEVADPLQFDLDCDDVGDACDNCVKFANDDQSDFDGDAFGEVCDNCPAVVNLDQADADADGDGVGDACDICPAAADSDQADSDGDGWGDACDLCPALAEPSIYDRDGDGVGDLCDNCIARVNPNQGDRDEDGIGNASDLDRYLVGGGSRCSTAGGFPSVWALVVAFLAAYQARRPRTSQAVPASLVGSDPRAPTRTSSSPFTE